MITLATEGKTLATKGKTLGTKGKTLATEGKTLATEGKTLVTKGKTLGRLHSLSECGFQVLKMYQAPAHIWGLPR